MEGIFACLHGEESGEERRPNLLFPFSPLRPSAVGGVGKAVVRKGAHVIRAC